MSRTRRHFTDEFKREAVRLCNESGATVTQIAHDLDIGDNVLRRWVRLARDGLDEPARQRLGQCADGALL